MTPSVLRYIRRTAEEYAARERAGQGAAQGFASYVFLLGTQHPAYLATPQWLPQERKPYAWFLRVPDLPRFVRAIAPVLERRLAGSALQGYSGERQISFYRDGLRLAFVRGRLTVAEPWQPRRQADEDHALGGEGGRDRGAAASQTWSHGRCHAQRLPDGPTRPVPNPLPGGKLCLGGALCLAGVGVLSRLVPEFGRYDARNPTP